MKPMLNNNFQNSLAPAMLTFVLLAAFTALPGCERAEQTNQQTATRAANSAESQPVANSEGGNLPLGDVAEFEGYTLRANVSPSEFLPEAMAQQHGIEAGPDIALLNLVITEKGTDQQPAAVSADVSAQYETLIGHVEFIDMRAVEADGHVSYIGTLDTSAQRIFRFVIEAQPANADEPLRMNFEVQLPTLDID